MRAWGGFALALGVACDGGLGETAVAVEPGAEVVRYAALDGCCDVLLGAPARGQVDVYTRDPGWELVGSFFAARSPLRELAVGRLGVLPLVFVMTDEEVTMLSSSFLESHQLRRPVRIFDDDGLRAIAVADFDRDGIAEVAVATRDGVEFIDETEEGLFEQVDEHADVDAEEILDGRYAALAAAELTGDAVPDLVAFRDDEPEALLISSPGFHEDGGAQEAATFEFPAPAVQALGVQCDATPVVAVLEDGSVIGLGAQEEPEEWRLPGPARAIRTNGRTVLVLYQDDTPPTYHRACGGRGQGIKLRSSDILDADISPRDAEGGPSIAILLEGEDELRIYPLR